MNDWDLHDKRECMCGICRDWRVHEAIRAEIHRIDKEETFRFLYGYDPAADPFPPGGTKTGRFKVNHPPYTQQTRYNRHPGKYRRVHDKALDVVNWQYWPGPGYEWETYFTATLEALAKSVATSGTAWTTNQFNKNANAALAEKRYYKIERVDSPS